MLTVLIIIIICITLGIMLFGMYTDWTFQLKDDPVPDDQVSDDPVSDDPVSDDPVSDDPVPDESVPDESVPDNPEPCNLSESNGYFQIRNSDGECALETVHQCGEGTDRITCPSILGKKQKCNEPGVEINKLKRNIRICGDDLEAKEIAQYSRNHCSSLYGNYNNADKSDQYSSLSPPERRTKCDSDDKCAVYVNSTKCSRPFEWRCLDNKDFISQTLPYKGMGYKRCKGAYI